MSKYRNLDPAMIAHVCAEVDQAIDEQNARAESDQRLAAQIAFIQNPKNAAALAADPWVQAIRNTDPALRTQQGVPSVTPRLGAAAQPGKLPPVIDNNSRFHPSHLKMKPATPQIESVKDSYVRRPNSI